MQSTDLVPRESACGEDIRVWRGWRPGEFQVHFIYTGVAESQFMVFPDGTSMLLDCGDHPAHARGDYSVPLMPSSARHSGEWIARYVKRVNPCGNYVDYMLLSHFHSDHGGCNLWHAGVAEGRSTPYFLSGFAHAAEWLHFGTAIDRGWPDYADPVPLGDDEQDGLLRNMKGLYAYLKERDGLKVEKFRLGACDQIVMRRSAERYNPGFGTFNFAANGRICSPTTHEVRDLYAAVVADGARGLNENAMSLGTLFTYGKFSFFTAGDFSDVIRLADGSEHFIEDDLAAIMPRVDVAKINHHGYHTMVPALADALDARCYVSCVWDQWHCTDDTMANLEASGTRGHLYFPGYIPTLFIGRDGGEPRPWMRKCPDAAWKGMHTVLTVLPGGDRYTMTCLSAADEEMRVVAEYAFEAG